MKIAQRKSIAGSIDAHVAPAVRVAHLYQKAEKLRIFEQDFVYSPDDQLEMRFTAVTSATISVPAVCRFLSLWLRRQPR